jgi:hypothetical protein
MNAIVKQSRGAALQSVAPLLYATRPHRVGHKNITTLHTVENKNIIFVA